MMKNARLAGLVALGIVIFIMVLAVFKPTDRPPLTMGYQICNSLGENHRRFDPLTAYLSKVLGRPIKAVHLDTGEFLDPAHQRYDLYHVNSLVYINLKERGAAQVMAGELQGEGKTKTQGWIIARKDSGITSLEDLKGKRLIFGPMLSPGGYLTQYYTMLKAGLNPEKDLAVYSFPWGAWKHEKVVYAVYYGAADAGTARYNDLETMGKDLKIDPEEFTVVAKSDWVPWCLMAASPDLDQKVVNQVSQALFSLVPESDVKIGSEKFAVLKWALVDGYVPADDGDYDLVREMARVSGMPPYQQW